MINANPGALEQTRQQRSLRFVDDGHKARVDSGNPFTSLHQGGIISRIEHVVASVDPECSRTVEVANGNALDIVQHNYDIGGLDGCELFFREHTNIITPCANALDAQQTVQVSDEDVGLIDLLRSFLGDFFGIKAYEETAGVFSLSLAFTFARMTSRYR